MFDFTKRNPKTKLEGLDRACEILNERYQKKQITIEQFQNLENYESNIKKSSKKRWENSKKRRTKA